MEFNSLSALQPHFPRAFKDNNIVRAVVLPVVHSTDKEQTLRNVLLARKCGADGVFIINHGFSYVGLLEIFSFVRESVPDFWIGVNLLGLSSVDIFKKVSPELLSKMNGIWVDDAGIDERKSDIEQDYAKRVSSLAQASTFRGLYFGGVAFKYQREVSELELAAKVATKWMDVVCTSGPGTGKAADLTKIERLRAGLGNRPLAIASGVTPENVTDYIPFANCFLVATGISSSFEELDEGKTLQLIQVVSKQA